MIRNSPRLRFWLLLALLMVSCSRPSPTAPQQSALAQAPAAAPTDRYANDVARFLAGLPANSGSPFAGLQDDPAWLRHRQDSDRSWEKLEAGPLPAMRAFQCRELADKAVAAAPVFYPFSGPDALMITLFFPHSPRYVMIGLEPAGTVPSPKQLSRKNLDRYLAGIRLTLASELSSSFFITRQMDRQFRGQVTDGLALPILYLLARTNHTIVGYRYVRLDDAGKLIDRAATWHAPGRIGNKGIEIDFRSDEDQSLHQLFYFSVNLSDDRLRENPAFLTWLASVDGSVSFLKATSYMTHRPEFSIIRQQVLAKSVAVLQDDSGIPYSYFATPWHVQLYGSYVHPYGSFKWLRQVDLQKAYRDGETRPLEFRIGYGYSKTPSNLLFARR
jgi:hypothetical protein